MLTALAKLVVVLALSANAMDLRPGPAKASGGPTGAAGGDLSGTYPNPTVTHTQPGSVDLSTVTTAFTWKASSGTNTDITALNGTMVSISTPEYGGISLDSSSVVGFGGYSSAPVFMAGAAKACGTVGFSNTANKQTGLSFSGQASASTPVLCVSGGTAASVLSTSRFVFGTNSNNFPEVQGGAAMTATRPGFVANNTENTGVGMYTSTVSINSDVDGTSTQIAVFDRNGVSARGQLTATSSITAQGAAVLPSLIGPLSVSGGSMTIVGQALLLDNGSASTFNSTATFASLGKFTNFNSTQAVASGYSHADGKNAVSGLWKVGRDDTDSITLNYDSSTDIATFTNGATANGADIRFATKGTATPIRAFEITGTGVNTSSSTSASITCNAGSPVAVTALTSNHGTFTAGASAANCTVTFGSGATFAKTPDCICADDTSVLAIKATAATSSLICTAAVSMSNDNITYICLSAP